MTHRALGWQQKSFISWWTDGWSRLSSDPTAPLLTSKVRRTSARFKDVRCEWFKLRDWCLFHPVSPEGVTAMWSDHFMLMNVLQVLWVRPSSMWLWQLLRFKDFVDILRQWRRRPRPLETTGKRRVDLRFWVQTVSVETSEPVHNITSVLTSAPKPNRKFFSSSHLLVLFCHDLEIESKPAETFSEESEARKVLMFCDGGALNSLVVPFFCAAFIYFYTDRSTKLWRSGRPLCRSIWTETENLTTIFISELWDEKSRHRDFYCHEGGEKTGNIQIQPAGVAALIWTVSWLIFSNRWIVSQSWRVLNSPSDRSVPGGGGGRASPHPEDVQHQRRRAEHLPPAGGQQPGLVLPAGGGGVGSKEWELQSSLWKETLRHKPPILKDKSWLCVCPCAGAGMPTELDNMESRWVMYRYCTGDVCKASEGLTAESRLRLQAASPGEQSDGRRGEDARHPLWAEEPGGVLQEEAGGSCLWSAEVLVLVSRGRRG